LMCLEMQYLSTFFFFPLYPDDFRLSSFWNWIFQYLSCCFVKNVKFCEVVHVFLVTQLIIFLSYVPSLTHWKFYAFKREKAYLPTSRDASCFIQTSECLHSW
jgi:hypothetical protein